MPRDTLVETKLAENPERGREPALEVFALLVLVIEAGRSGTKKKRKSSGVSFPPLFPFPFSLPPSAIDRFLFDARRGRRRKKKLNSPGEFDHFPMRHGFLDAGFEGGFTGVDGDLVAVGRGGGRGRFVVGVGCHDDARRGGLLDGSKGFGEKSGGQDVFDVCVVLKNVRWRMMLSEVTFYQRNVRGTSSAIVGYRGGGAPQPVRPTSPIAGCLGILSH
jgi:hypothetical protein